jgi:hypothetical protein
MLRLVRPLHGEVDVGGLLGRQLRQLRAEVLEVEASHLFIELLVERVDVDVVRLGPLRHRQIRDLLP